MNVRINSMELKKKALLFQVIGVLIMLIGHLIERVTGINALGVGLFLVGFVLLIFGSWIYVKMLFKK